MCLEKLTWVAELKILVDGASVLDGIKRDHPARVVNPGEDSIIAHAVFVEALKAGGEIAERLGDPFGVRRQPLELFSDSLSDGRAEFAEGALEGWSNC
jgi:hypothetical protein